VCAKSATLCDAAHYGAQMEGHEGHVTYCTSSFHDMELVPKNTVGVDIMKQKHVYDYNVAVDGTDLKHQKLQPCLMERKRNEVVLQIL
jgi:hypothetical protein